MGDLFDRGRSQTLTKAVATAAEPLTTDTAVVYPNGYWVSAPDTNTVSVYLCAPGDLAGKGFGLEPGGRLFLNREHPSVQYCVAAVAGQTLEVLAP